MTIYQKISSNIALASVRGIDVADSTNVDEHHAIIHSGAPGEPFAVQLATVIQAVDHLRAHLGESVKPVMARWFLSDAANQAAALPEWSHCAVSVVEQSPLDGTKVALWLYLMSDVTVTHDPESGIYAATHGAYNHLWRASMAIPSMRSEVATRALLGDYALALANRGASLADNCVRTWFFVHDVDVNYVGMVKGRNELFSSCGLSASTHFIASTGIGGAHPDPRVTVQLDTYAIKGINPGQITYINAPSHLNPTIEYGVAFERATRIDYGDRHHLLISGTASINNRGEVVHPGDVKAQTRRMWDNVEALLAEGGASWLHVMHMIVYLRDIADFAVVSKMFNERFPNVPRTIVLAPVCRPEWLIEMECMAVVPTAHPEWPTL